MSNAQTFNKTIADVEAKHGGITEDVTMSGAVDFTGTLKIDGTTVSATAAQLNASATLPGYIPVPLSTLREVSSNDIPTDGTDDEPGGGVLSKSSTPALEFANGDTDSALRVSWASSNNDPVVFQLPLPPDFDAASDLEVHMRAAMGGATDDGTANLDTYFNEGDTKVEDSTTFDGTDYAEATATVAAADIPSGAQTVTVEITPSDHTTDAMYLSALWLEYTRTA